MMTEHKFHIGSSCDMQELEDNSIELVVTSPPYPMIEMWDDLFMSLEVTDRNLLNEQLQAMHNYLGALSCRMERVTYN